MPFEKPLFISQLLLDNRNPRLPMVPNSQLEAIKTMASTQMDKIIALADHIVYNGLNPASLPIVMEADEEEMYYVLDGNRRITVLKLLETASLMDGIFTGSKLKKMRELSTRFGESPIVELSCVVVEDRDEADKWIQLIHRGQQQGAGLVEWDGQVAARYDARRDNKIPIFALEVLDFVNNNATLSEKTIERIDKGKFPITSLQRLINTLYVRKKLGIDRDSDGKAVTMFPKEEILKGLARVVDDLGSGRITVSKIKSQDQRIDYINSFGRDELPDSTKEFNTARKLDDLSTDEDRTAKTSSRKQRSQSYSRSTLIPTTCKLKISDARISKIFAELKRLNIDTLPNAGAVMLRVFIELSLDHYLEHVIGWPEAQIDGTKLAQKLKAVANYFETNNTMSAQQLAPINKAASGQTLLAASVKTMNGYVHNRYFSPVASELKTVWDDFQLFMENLWPA